MVHGSAESTVAKLRPQGSGWSGLRPLPSGPCVGGAGRPDLQDQDLRQQSFVSFLVFSWPQEGNSRWPHHLKHPPPKFLDWGGGGRRGAAPTLTDFFGNIFWGFGGEREHSSFENFIALLQPLLLRLHTPPPPILVEMRGRGGLEAIVVMETSHTSILPGPMGEQKGGGSTSQCIGVAKRRQGCAPTGLCPLVPNPFLS